MSMKDSLRYHGNRDRGFGKGFSLTAGSNTDISEVGTEQFVKHAGVSGVFIQKLIGYILMVLSR